MEILSRIYDRLFPRYKCFIILGDSGGTPAWHWESWRQLWPLVSGLADTLSVKPSIHSRQVIRGRSSSPPLGRLSWTEEGHQRWCHHSPLTAHRCDDWLFVDTEVFMPRRAELIKSRAYPKAYIEVFPTPDIDDSVAAYDQEVLVAVDLQQYLEHSSSVMQFVREIQPLLGAVLLLSETRRVVSLNQFEDIIREDLTYRGMHHDQLPRLEKARGRWVVERLEWDDAEQGHEADGPQVN